jgi:hypothetical protein
MTMGIGEDGEYGYRPLLAALTDTLAELVGSGVVREDELRSMTIPTVSRRAADFMAPFAPSGRFERLEIEHLEIFDGEDRFYAQYRKDKDPKAFGDNWGKFARASVFPTMVGALDGGRDDPRAAQFLDRLEAGIAARLAAAPEQTQIPLAQLVLHKRPKIR